MELTFAIVKPDAVSRSLTGKILDRIEAEGFVVRGMRKLHLTPAQAGAFYAVHKERPFYGGLCAFMSSGPIVVLALEAEGAIARWRTLMGATDPAKAAEGTLRKLYGQGIERNATHGSDAPETARTEIAFFFSGLDLV